MRDRQVLGIMLGATLVAAGCASYRVTYDKAGISDIDRRRDEGECLRMAVASNDRGFLLLPFETDREVYDRCMQQRGYTLRFDRRSMSKAAARS